MVHLMTKLPKVLPYPKFFGIEHLDNVKNVLCYVIEDYGIKGMSILITRNPKEDKSILLLGDWDGNVVDPKVMPESYNSLVSTHMQNIITTMRLINIEQAQYFFDDKSRLVDVQVGINKFLGPGMLRDIFGRMFDTQEISCIKVIDDDYISALKSTGQHKIIKPSRFRIAEANAKSEAIPHTYSPLYVRT